MNKVYYATIIPGIQKSQSIHTHILYVALLITYLAASHIFQGINLGFCEEGQLMIG